MSADQLIINDDNFVR